ncbi:MAG TPA: winged helix-turn-helix domain-containing protein [Candidatus Scybalocola faecipullorum]|nr:winged helix-turn-helix domain-containing protein [Candidatus Scybalocola faecipullorum]
MFKVQHTVLVWEVLVNKLRDKIEDDPSEPKFIKTVWGVGYRFQRQ